MWQSKTAATMVVRDRLSRQNGHCHSTQTAQLTPFYFSKKTPKNPKKTENPLISLCSFPRLFSFFSFLEKKKKLGNPLSFACVGKALLGGDEAMLDTEYISSMGANISTEFWGFQGKEYPTQGVGLWLKWVTLMANTSDAEVPRVFSTSYGEDENFVAADYADRINVEFMKAGARGITLLFSSGDTGAAAVDPPTGCPKKKFTPKWPAASDLPFLIPPFVLVNARGY